MVKDLLKSLLWRGGILGLYHRLRNRRTLTVLMLHRVLPPDDPRWPGCDPDYTLPVSLLDDSLRFVQKHYNIVTPAQVLAANAGRGRLPARALLVTFDDGWADTLEHALPRLRAAGITAWIMVAADAVGGRQAFWPERLVAAWRHGSLAPARLAAAVADLPEPAGQAPGGAIGWPLLRSAIARLQALPAAARTARLDNLADALAEPPGLPPAMLDPAGLARWCDAGGAVGAHGASHEPLDSLPGPSPALEAELAGARRRLNGLVPGDGDACRAASFPHGRFNAWVRAAALEAGYALLMCSRPVLNRLPLPRGALLGRVALDAAALSDDSGRFRPERLALHLFRRPHATL